MSKKLSRFDEFTTISYSGRELLKKHSLDEEGVWCIRGEDPNCDMGGHHHSPELGYCEGKLRDVIEYAVNLKGFWSWGGGGDITLHSPPVVIKINPDTARQREELQNSIDDLKKNLAYQEEQLRKLGG